MRIPQYLAQQTPNTRPLPLPEAGVVNVSGLTRGIERGVARYEQGQAEQESQAKELAAVQKRESDRVEADEARVWTANTLSEMRMEAEQAFADAQANPAPGFAKGLVERFKTQAEDRMKSAPALARAGFQAEVAQTTTSLFNRGVQFEIGQRTAAVRDSFTSGTDTRAALAYANPQSAIEMLALNDTLADSITATPEQRAALKRNGGEAIAYSAAMKQAEMDPAGFIKRAQNPAGDVIMSRLKPQQLALLDQRAKTDIEQAQNRARIEAEKALKDAEKANDEVRQFGLTGELPSPEFIASATARTAGTPFAASTLAMLQMAQKGAGYGAMSLPQQKAALMEQAGKPTNPEQQKFMAQARQITESQERAYKENPWEAAARFTRAPRVDQVKIEAGEQLPQIIAQRVPLLARVEQASGMPASVLQPSEVPQAIAALRSMSITARAEVLGAMGEMLDGPHIAALATELDKGDRPTALMLRLNDRTVAGRTLAELVAHGAQALKDKTVKRDDAVLTGWKSEIASMVRGTLGNEADETDVIDAAYYLRAQMDIEGGTAPGFDKDPSNERAVRMVIGQPMERAGVKTLLPRGITQEQFDEKLTSAEVRSQVPQTVYVRGQAVPGESLAYRLPAMGLKRAPGYGFYTPVSNNAPVTIDKDGTTPLRLTIR